MRLLVVPQVFHAGEAHSIDINCSNDLVATGGADHQINIWKLDSLVSLVDQDSKTIPRVTPYKTLLIHESTIKLLKWSPVNEHILISANEEGKLTMTNVQENTHQTLYPYADQEKYKRNSVVDGCWSSDGRLFAWSSVDGRLHVYDTEKNTHQYLMEEETPATEDHKTTIQRSIAFDPTNKYLVAMGDDTFITIFHYHYDSHAHYRFKIINKISKLMSNSVSVPSGVKYRRISWSCDGELFAVPNASQQSSSVITLMSTSQNWENNISLVGHDLECDLVKFAPHIYEAKDTKLESESKIQVSPDYNVYHVIATAGSDNTLVFWNTSKESPISIIMDVAEKPIVDLVWEKSGKYVLMVNMDGLIIIVKFLEGDLGQRVSEEFFDQLKNSQKSALKVPVIKDEYSAKKSRTAIKVIKQEDATNITDSKSPQQNPRVSICDATEEKSGDSIQKSVSQEVRLGEITPSVLVTGNLETEATEEVDRNKHSETENDQIVTNGTKKIISQVSHVPRQIQGRQKTITTKDGKKRIQPTLISNGHETGQTNNIRDLRIEPSTKCSKSFMEYEKPSLRVPDEFSKDIKRPRQSDEQNSTKKAKRELEPVKFIGSVVCNPTTSFARMRLAVPKTRIAFRINDDEIDLDIKNGQGNESVPSRVTCLKEENQMWSDFIPRFIHLATAGDIFWAISTSDGQLCTYSKLSGKRLLPTIILGSPLSYLESKGDFLMAVTSVGELFVWNLAQKKIHIKSPSSLASLLDLNSKLQEETLSRSDSVTMCSVTSKGIPLITLSNGCGYMYNTDMETWQTVSETWWAFGSHYWDSIADDKISTGRRSAQLSGEQKGSSLVALMEHKTNEELVRKSRSGRGKFFNKISKNMIMKEGFENLENTVSLAHLENRILCSEILGESDDFSDFLITYTNRLCELGSQAKFYEICEKILGSLGPDEGVNSAKICGLDRRELLKRILLSCAEHREMQKILVHFGSKIGIIEREYS